MPELDLGLAEPPAEQHAASRQLAGKIHESEPPILELDPQVVQLALVAIDLARQRLRVALELPGALVGSSARPDDATRSSSRILSRHARCCRTTSSTMRRTSGSVRLASSTVNIRFMRVPSFAPPRVP
jgi:hypothetical protein